MDDAGKKKRKATDEGSSSAGIDELGRRTKAARLSINNTSHVIPTDDAAADDAVAAAEELFDAFDTVAAVDVVVAAAAENVAAGVDGGSADGAAADTVANTSFTEEEAKGLPKRRRHDLEASFEYEEETIGSGTYSEVRKVRRKNNESWAAAKLILKSENPNHLKYIRRELQILLTLDQHDNICRLIESFTWNNRQVYLHLELCRIDLRDFQNKIMFDNPIDPIDHSYIKNILQQILTGVAYMHYKKVLHRDLKGKNILLTDEGDVKITDFGLGRLMDIPAEGRSRHHSGRIGTTRYMAPEMIMSKTDYGGEVDVWSIGVIAHDLYTDEVFQARGEEDRLNLLRTINAYVGDIPDVPDNLPDVPIRCLNTGPQPEYSPLFMKIYNVTENDMTAADFVKELLTLKQSERPSAEVILRHEYFTSEPLPAPKEELAEFIYNTLVNNESDSDDTSE